MGSYGSDDEALIGLARQLTDAYGEARGRDDQDYACESIAEYLAEFRQSAPSEALLAFLGLPLTAETYPLVDEVQVVLGGRGPAVVEPLLAAVLGDVYDPDGSAPERAAETLDQMDPTATSRGLTEVLCGRGGDDLKGAAVNGLVALGGLAEPELVVALDDPEGGDWARAALDQIRYAHEHAGGGDEDAYVGGDEPVGSDADDAAVGVADATDATDGLPDEPKTLADAGAAGQPAAPEAAAGAIAEPDSGVVDDAYEDFLKRFELDPGDETPPS